MLPTLPTEDVSSLAAGLATKILMATTCDGRRPRSALAVAHRIGVRVVRSPHFIADNAGQYRGGTIRVHARLGESEREATIAHELGHHVCAVERLTYSNEEQIADAFGAALLAMVAAEGLATVRDVSRGAR